MKNKIGLKLTAANAIIIVVALLFFCIMSLTIFNNYMKKSIKEQLITESSTTYRLAVASLIVKSQNDDSALENMHDYTQPAVYKLLTESFSIILMHEEQSDEYEIVYSSLEGFDAKIDVANLQEKIEASDDGVIQVNINSTNYLCTMQSSKPRRNSKATIVAVSLIPLSSVSKVNRQYVFAFLVAASILVTISIVIMSIISSRITKPIVRLTKLTKQYSGRDFGNKYIANTNDEIEDLSKSISTMAQSLEKQDKHRDKMFRNISHELKTPLTAIYGYAEGIKNGVFVNTEEPLDIIMSESLRIKKLTEDIIYLSKLESHIEVFKLGVHDISDVMINAIHSIESIAIMNDIDIRFIPTSIEPILVDGDKIHRALINILSNCVKYTKDVIDIEINDRKESVEIIVSDNGSGFKNEDIENLLNGMTKEKSDGSGIGLSIVNEIIKGHDGKFYIGNSKLGGAVFTIVLKK